MTQTSREEGRAENLLATFSLVVFWCAFASLAAGLALWVADHASGAAARLLMAGLVGLLLMPLLRLLAAIVSAIRERDRVLLWATLTVLAILVVLTLRDAVRSPALR
jgi:hypothetical protein